MIKGLYETHLFVKNMKRYIDFYFNKIELEQCPSKMKEVQHFLGLESLNCLC